MQTSRNDFTIIKKQVSSGNRIMIDFLVTTRMTPKTGQRTITGNVFEIGKISRFGTM